MLGAVTTLVGVLGLTTRPLPVLAPALALLALAGLLPSRPAGEHAAPPPASRTSRRGTRPGAGRTGRRPGRGPAGLLVAARVAVLSAGIPVSANDEYALWMLRARSLSQLGGLDPRVFVDGAAGYQHQEYPLFVPALAGWLDSWAGRPSDPAAHVAVALTLGALLASPAPCSPGWPGRPRRPPACCCSSPVPTLLALQSLRLMADVTVFSFAFGLTLVLLVVVTEPHRPGAGTALAGRRRRARRRCGRQQERGARVRGDRVRAGLLVATGRRRGVAVAGAAALAANLPWIAFSRVHHLSSWVANQDTLSAGHLRAVLPWTGHVARGMVDRWPGGSWAGALLAVAALVAAVLAVRAGHWRPVVLVALVVAVATTVLLAQYVAATAYGPPADPRAGPLLDGQWP